MMFKNHPLYLEDLNTILSTIDFSKLSGKSILITGATGLIGTQLIDALMLLNKRGGNIKIKAVGRNKLKASTRFGEYYDDPLFDFVEHDILFPFTEDIKVDYIIHGASNTHPLAYSEYPIETMLVNIKGAENTLNLSVRCTATLLYLSSVEIYGNAVGKDIFTEDYTGELNLSTSRACYTESKRASEALCQSYIAEKNVSVKIARLSRVFGPTFLESDSKASSQFIKKAIAKEDIVLKSTGEQFYSYTYVTDAIIAILFIMLNGKDGLAYNISNENCNIRLKDFAKACADYAGTNVIYDLPSEKEMKGFSIAMQAILDNTRLKELNWYPVYSFDNSLNRTIEIVSDKK